MKTTSLIILIFLLTGCTSASTIGTNNYDTIEPRSYTADYEKVFFAAVDAVTSLKWQITFTDKETGIISAKTPANFLTWGDEVSIRIRQDNDKVRVDVSSGTNRQLIDWGKNAQNIRNLYLKMDSILKRIE